MYSSKKKSKNLIALRNYNFKFTTIKECNVHGKTNIGIGVSVHTQEDLSYFNNILLVEQVLRFNSQHQSKRSSLLPYLEVKSEFELPYYVRQDVNMVLAIKYCANLFQCNK